MKIFYLISIFLLLLTFGCPGVLPSLPGITPSSTPVDTNPTVETNLNTDEAIRVIFQTRKQVLLPGGRTILTISVQNNAKGTDVLNLKASLQNTDHFKFVDCDGGLVNDIEQLVECIGKSSYNLYDLNSVQYDNLGKKIQKRLVNEFVETEFININSALDLLDDINSTNYGNLENYWSNQLSAHEKALSKILTGEKANFEWDIKAPLDAQEGVRGIKYITTYDYELNTDINFLVIELEEIRRYESRNEPLPAIAKTTKNNGPLTISLKNNLFEASSDNSKTTKDIELLTTNTFSGILNPQSFLITEYLIHEEIIDVQNFAKENQQFYSCNVFDLNQLGFFAKDIFLLKERLNKETLKNISKKIDNPSIILGNKLFSCQKISKIVEEISPSNLNKYFPKENNFHKIYSFKTAIGFLNKPKDIIRVTFDFEKIKSSLKTYSIKANAYYGYKQDGGLDIQVRDS